LTHATGHASRLGRDLSGTFGSKNYAREELVAEIGSAFLCAALRSASCPPFAILIISPHGSASCATT
jgi:antirestriction protein ArdC